MLTRCKGTVSKPRGFLSCGFTGTCVYEQMNENGRFCGFGGPFKFVASSQYWGFPCLVLLSSRCGSGSGLRRIPKDGITWSRRWACVGVHGTKLHRDIRDCSRSWHVIAINVRYLKINWVLNDTFTLAVQGIEQRIIKITTITQSL